MRGGGTCQYLTRFMNNTFKKVGNRCIKVTIIFLFLFHLHSFYALPQVYWSIKNKTVFVVYDSHSEYCRTLKVFEEKLCMQTKFVFDEK